MKMARQPWRLAEEDLLSLMKITNTSATRTGSATSLNTTWSKGELVQAILVISTFLSLSNFVLSCGIAPEMDMEGGYRIRHPIGSYYGIENELNDTVHPQHGNPSVFSHPRPSLSVEDAMAVRAASSATGWYDSQISPKSSQNGSSDGDNDGNVSEPYDDLQQQGLSKRVEGTTRYNGDGSTSDSEEDDNNSAVNDGTLDVLYLDETTALISKLKSTKDTNKELHQSLATLDLFSSNESDESSSARQHQGIIGRKKANQWKSTLLLILFVKHLILLLSSFRKLRC